MTAIFHNQIAAKLDTLVEATTKSIGPLKKEIVEALHSNDLRMFASLGTRLHYKHGQLCLYADCLYAVRDLETDEEAKSRLQEIVFASLLGAESDTWSGRGNDAVRCQNDGKRDAADKLQWMWRYE